MGEDNMAKICGLGGSAQPNERATARTRPWGLTVPTNCQGVEELTARVRSASEIQTPSIDQPWIDGIVTLSNLEAT